MSDFVYLAKWCDGTFSFMFGQDQKTLLFALDRIGDPSDAQVRVVPPELMREISFDEKKETGHFEISEEVERVLWQKCAKQVWPLESLGS